MMPFQYKNDVKGPGIIFLLLLLIYLLLENNYHTHVYTNLQHKTVILGKGMKSLYSTLFKNAINKLNKILRLTSLKFLHI